MSYYILPKINSQIVINPSKTHIHDLQTYISHSLLQYVNAIKKQIDYLILNANDLSLNEIVKSVNPCEYIFSKIPGSKYSVSKLKPDSNVFYEFLEICNTFNIFEIYENISINSLHISENKNDSIECFEMLRENYEDNITSYNNFSIKEIEMLNEKFEILVFEKPSMSLKNYFTYLASCMLTILKCQIKNGSCIIKIDNACYKPVIDLMYFLSSLYDKVYILKPNSSNITTFEKYIICKNYQCKTDFTNINYHTLKSFVENNDDNNDNNDDNNNVISAFLDYATPYYFLSKIEDINVIIGYQQIESLDLISNIVKNKNREDKIETLKKTNITKAISWCEKYKIPCNKFAERVNIFLPLANKEKEENVVMTV